MCARVFQGLLHANTLAHSWEVPSCQHSDHNLISPPLARPELSQEQPSPGMALLLPILEIAEGSVPTVLHSRNIPQVICYPWDSSVHDSAPVGTWKGLDQESLEDLAIPFNPFLSTCS